MASSCAGASSKMTDEASSKDAASRCSQLLSGCTLSSVNSGSGDADVHKRNRTPGSGYAAECSSEPGASDAEQPATADPSCERVQCATAPYEQGDADPDTESEDTEVADDADAEDGVQYDPEDTDSAVESEDAEFEDDDDDDAVGVFNIPAMPPLRPPGQ